MIKKKKLLVLKHGFIFKTARRRIICRSCLMISISGVIWYWKSSRFAGGTTYTQSDGKKGGMGTFPVGSSTLTPLSEANLPKICHFWPIFDVCSRDAPPQVPPLCPLKPTGRPVKGILRGLSPGTLGSTLPVQFQSVGTSPYLLTLTLLIHSCAVKHNTWFH